MPSLVALIVVIVAAEASALPAKSHDWYQGGCGPRAGMPCCNERDCHSVAARVNRDTGDEEIHANGGWYPVEYGKVLVWPRASYDSPDRLAQCRSDHRRGAALGRTSAGRPVRQEQAQGRPAAELPS